MNPLFRSFTKKKKKKHLAKVNNLRKDLVLCKRIPVRGFRSVCKKRNLLSRDRSFTKKKKKKKLPAKLTKVSDLPKDLTEEILSRLPLTSVRALRSACKKWNTLSKDPSFTRKHLLAQAKAAAEAARDFDLMVVMVIDFKVFLTTINIHKGSVDHQGKLISLENSNQVDISQVFHCGGLVLCITRDYSRFVVWNPYSCETLWLEPTSPDHPRLDWYLFAIGYDENSRNYKVLRFVDGFEDSVVEYEIYDLNNSTSWRVLDVASDWYIFYFARGVSVKGNTYWFAVEKKRSMVEFADFLICFDFTRERFGPRLRLPFFPHEEDTVTLSSVREEQLAVLFQPWDSLHMDIWVTTRIEPHLVSWSKLWSLAVNMEPLIGFQFGITSGSFFIDQENKVVVVFEKDKGRYTDRMVRHNTAYFIGEDGYFREVDLGETSELHICPLGCSYVPSSVQIKQTGSVIY